MIHIKYVLLFWGRANKNYLGHRNKETYERSQLDVEKDISVIEPHYSFILTALRNTKIFINKNIKL